MTYQRNIAQSLLSEEDVFDDTLEDEIRRVQEDADDQAGDQHDRNPLDQLRLPRPLDLLQLSPRLGDEAPEAAAGKLALAAAVARGDSHPRGTRHSRLRTPRPLDLRGAVARC